MATAKEPKPSNLVVVVFDRHNDAYSVNSGPWLKHGFQRARSKDTSEQRPSGSGKPPERTTGSTIPEQTTGSTIEGTGTTAVTGTTAGTSNSDEDILMCLRSTEIPGHQGHCHWHVWDGEQWVDTGKHGCSC
jgi:hypothetical protein